MRVSPPTTMLWKAVLFLMVITPGVSLLIRVVEKRFDGPWLMISDLGTTQPEGTVFALGLFLTSILSFILLLRIYQRFEAYSDNFFSIGILLGLAWSVGLLVVAFNDSSASPKLHNIGAGITFTSLPLSSLSLAIWAKKITPENKIGMPKGGYVLPSISILTTVLFYASHEFAHYVHSGVILMSEMEGGPGWFALFTTLEWFLGLVSIGIIWSWGPMVVKVGVE